jgi:hypothetical protein
MVYDYPLNTQHFKVSYNRVREGPNWIMMYYKNAATVCMTVKDVKKRLGAAKFLDSSKALYKWLEEMVEQYGDVHEEARADTSFASEVLIENQSGLDSSDPNHQTRMVV